MAVVQITVQGKNESRDALTSTARDVDLLDKAVGKLKNTAAALGLSFSAIKLFELGKEATLMAARYETLGVTMDVVGARAGYSAEQMDQFEQKLHKTGIAMIESRETLTKMASAHMDLAKSAELARIAQDAAVIGNTNSSEAFNRMIDGIQRGEVEILKTIGINVNFEQSYKKLAQQLGKTADELTETEKVTARTNAVLEKGKDISGAYEAAMGTAGKQLNSMKRYVDDLKVALGETFQDALIVMVEKFTGGLKEANTEAEKLQQQGQIKEWGKDVVLTFAAIGDVAAIAVKGVQTLIDALLQSGDNMTRTFDILAQFGSGNFRGGINALQKMRDMNEQTRDELKKRWTTATPYTDAANRMYADRAANKAADDEKKKAMEDRIKAEGEAARQAEETRAKAEAEEKRYLENIKNSIAGAKEYGGVMKDLGKERLQFANDKFSDSLKEDIELYKQGGRAAEDLIRSLKRYNTEANAVFNERLAGEKSALAKLGDLYSEFKARIAINSQSKEAKAAGLEVLKAYRDTAQGVISIEQDRYRTLLAGERQYAQQVLTLIQAKKQEIRDLKQAIVDADKAFQERMRGDLQGQYVTGQYAYLDNSLDPYEKRKAQIAEIRRLEAEYDAIADPALKQKKMMGLISAWEQLGNQVDIVTKKVRPLRIGNSRLRTPVSSTRKPRSSKPRKP